MSGAHFLYFVLAALIIAVVPGPGIFYVAARTLSSGRSVGLSSSFGTALGGLVHVIAGGFGISAIILAGAQFFAALKFAGAIYLVWLGLRTLREANRMPAELNGNQRRVLIEGIAVEALNPKTAAFFLAFIPQFLDPAAPNPALQFMLLGLISVALNTAADIVVVLAASATCQSLAARPDFVRRLRQGSGLFIAGLGVSLAFVRRPLTI